MCCLTVMSWDRKSWIEVASSCANIWALAFVQLTMTWQPVYQCRMSTAVSKVSRSEVKKEKKQWKHDWDLFLLCACQRPAELILFRWRGRFSHWSILALLDKRTISRDFQTQKLVKNKHLLNQRRPFFSLLYSKKMVGTLESTLR